MYTNHKLFAVILCKNICIGNIFRRGVYLIKLLKKYVCIAHFICCGHCFVNKRCQHRWLAFRQYCYCNKITPKPMRHVKSRKEYFCLRLQLSNASYGTKKSLLHRVSGISSVVKSSFVSFPDCTRFTSIQIMGFVILCRSNRVCCVLTLKVTRANFRDKNGYISWPIVA
jgi:hypothetical protein